MIFIDSCFGIAVIDTIKIALDTWRNYMQDDEEQTKSYNDFHAIQTKDINKD